MRSSISQCTTHNAVSDLILNISLNTKECFRLTGFCTILYRPRPILFLSHHGPLDFNILTILGGQYKSRSSSLRNIVNYSLTSPISIACDRAHVFINTHSTKILLRGYRQEDIARLSTTHGILKTWSKLLRRPPFYVLYANWNCGCALRVGASLTT
jgi:hypothetical protein